MTLPNFCSIPAQVIPAPFPSSSNCLPFTPLTQSPCFLEVYFLAVFRALNRLFPLRYIDFPFPAQTFFQDDPLAGSSLSAHEAGLFLGLHLSRVCVHSLFFPPRGYSPTPRISISFFPSHYLSDCTPFPLSSWLFLQGATCLLCHCSETDSFPTQ